MQLLVVIVQEIAALLPLNITDFYLVKVMKSPRGSSSRIFFVYHLEGLSDKRNPHQDLMLQV